MIWTHKLNPLLTRKKEKVEWLRALALALHRRRPTARLVLQITHPDGRLERVPCPRFPDPPLRFEVEYEPDPANVLEGVRRLLGGGTR